jgi:hypothetical protein
MPSRTVLQDTLGLCELLNFASRVEVMRLIEKMDVMDTH